MSPQHHVVGWRLGPLPYSSHTPSVLWVGQPVLDSRKSSNAMTTWPRTATNLPLYRSGWVAMSHTAAVVGLPESESPKAVTWNAATVTNQTETRLPMTAIVSQVWRRTDIGK
jgi:hypothetical protein